jgi:hypothetical protein
LSLLSLSQTPEQQSKRDKAANAAKMKAMQNSKPAQQHAHNTAHHQHAVDTAQSEAIKTLKGTQQQHREKLICDDHLQCHLVEMLLKDKPPTPVTNALRIAVYSQTQSKGMFNKPILDIARSYSHKVFREETNKNNLSVLQMLQMIIQDNAGNPPDNLKNALTEWNKTRDKPEEDINVVINKIKDNTYQHAEQERINQQLQCRTVYSLMDQFAENKLSNFVAYQKWVSDESTDLEAVKASVEAVMDRKIKQYTDLLAECESMITKEVTTHDTYDLKAKAEKSTDKPQYTSIMGNRLVVVRNVETFKDNSHAADYKKTLLKVLEKFVTAADLEDFKFDMREMSVLYIHQKDDIKAQVTAGKKLLADLKRHVDRMEAYVNKAAP